ncbi:MAG: hypothetical protein OHK0012_23100 [Synechococcales cyanobacterium]
MKYGIPVIHLAAGLVVATVSYVPQRSVVSAGVLGTIASMFSYLSSSATTKALQESRPGQPPLRLEAPSPLLDVQTKDTPALEPPLPKPVPHDVQGFIQDQNQQIQQLKQSCQTLDTQLADAHRRLEQLHGQLYALESQKSDLHEENQQITQEKQRLARHIEQLNQQLDRDLQELADSADADIESLKAEIKSLKKERDDLRKDQQALIHPSHEPEEFPELDNSVYAHCYDVHSALTYARNQLPILDIFSTAFDSALTCHPGGAYPVKVYEALAKLAQLSQQKFQEPLNKDFIIAMREQGVQCSRESYTVMHRLRHTRTFQGHVMDLHIKIGYAVRIYFELDETAQKVRIGYCGNHLPIASQD